MADMETRWQRLAKFARHPNTIPHGEIEVQAELLVWVDDQNRALAKRLAESRGSLGMLRDGIDSLGNGEDARVILRSSGVRMAVDCLMSAVQRSLAELEADSGTDEDDGTIAAKIEEAEGLLKDLRVYAAHVKGDKP